ncbi:hypothetical protein R1flu_001469 [Riccia fluitans]|uniref:Replitron HUH endonuclease domain-containing protein n=1 Tax=Riccia fluitans TaxID=41844 RepID=A0ABD1Y4C8_9MARC
MGVLALERGDTFLQLHIQGMMRLKTSSIRRLKSEIKTWIGWDYGGPIGGSICIKSVRTKELNTVTGLIGYCLKDEGLDHFHFYSKNVSDEQKDEGRRIHNIYGTSEYKHRVELTPANILGRALQFQKYNVKNLVSIKCRSCIHEMLRSGKYMAGFRWLTRTKISRLRAERIWRACTTPQSVEVKDVDNILFGINTPARYFQAGSEGSSKQVDHDVERIEQSDAAAEDNLMSRIPIVDLERNVDSGANLDRVRDSLLYVGFGVAMKRRNNDVKQEKAMDDLPDYCNLWDKYRQQGRTYLHVDTVAKY